MPENRLLAIVTMALMLGPSQSVGQQAATLDELYAIENLIGGKDCGALYSFLTSKSHLVTGGDSLANELRSFMRDVEAGRLDCYNSASVQTDGLRFRSGPPRGQSNNASDTGRRNASGRSPQFGGDIY